MIIRSQVIGLCCASSLIQVNSNVQCSFPFHLVYSELRHFYLEQYNYVVKFVLDFDTCVKISFK